MEITELSLCHARNDGPNNSQATPKLILWKKFRGIGFILLFSILFSVKSVILKKLEHYHPMSVSVWLHATIFIMTFPIIIYYFRARNWGILISGFPVNRQERGILVIVLIVRSA